MGDEGGEGDAMAENAKEANMKEGKSVLHAMFQDHNVVSTNEERIKAFINTPDTWSLLSQSSSSGKKKLVISPKHQVLEESGAVTSGTVKLGGFKTVMKRKGKMLAGTTSVASMDKLEEVLLSTSVLREATASARFPRLLNCDKPDFDRRLGCRSRFGDGDGSFWDRWLVTSSSGYMKEDAYMPLKFPNKTSHASGTIRPRAGFKRFSTDPLLTPYRVPPYRLRKEDPEQYWRSNPHLSDEDRRRISDMIRGVVDSDSDADTDEEVEEKEGDLDDDEDEFTRQGIKTRRMLDATTKAKGGKGAKVNKFGKTGRPSVLDPSTWKTVTTASLKNNSGMFVATSAKLGANWVDNMTGSMSGMMQTMGMETSGSMDSTGTQNLFKAAGPGGSKQIKRTRDQDDMPVVQALQLMSMSLTVELDEEEDNDPIIRKVKKKYCGELARAEFFRYYKQVNRDRARFTPKQVVRLVPYDYDGSRLLDVIKEEEVKVQRPVLVQPLPLAQRGLTRAMSGSSIGTAASGDSGDQSNATQATDDLENDVAAPEVFLDTLCEQYDGNITSRTRYLHGCLEKNLLPRANLLLRKSVSHTIDLSHEGIGDSTMLVLARAIAELPSITRLDLTDNMLTDKSLPTVARALCDMKNLTSLTISDNKMDRLGAKALNDYLGSHAHHLRILAIARADVDDEECAQFVASISNKTKVHTLDLSKNQIGTAELRNVVHPEFTTGGEAIASALLDPNCLITELDLSWNYLRLNSAVEIGKAVRYNKTLTYLNLEYNGFGTQGAEELGMSLFFNSTLKKLNLANNNVTSRGAFVIAVALKQNKTLRGLDLSGNPLGVRGGKEVMSIATWVKEPLRLKLRGCNFAVHDVYCWFDVENPIGNYTLDVRQAYDRAVLMSLLQRLERDESLQLLDIIHSANGQTNRVVLERKSSTEYVSEAAWKVNFPEVEAAFKKATGGDHWLDFDKVQGVMAELGCPMVDAETECKLKMYHRQDTTRQCISLEDLYHLFMTTRTAHTELGLESSKMVDASTKRPWAVPVDGTVNITVKVKRVRPPVSASSTPQQIANLLRLAGSVENKDTLIAMSLPQLRLHVAEALLLYRELVKDRGDRVLVLTDMLPYVAGPFECRTVVAEVLQGLESEKRRLRDHLGPAFGPLFGLYSGHYRLDLSKQIHVLTAEKLLAIDNTESTARKEANLSDTSQMGDYSNFRNIRWNNKGVDCTANDYGTFEHYWDSYLRKQQGGILELNYISISRPEAFLAPEEDDELLEMAVKFGLVQNTREMKHIARLDLRRGGTFKSHNRETGKRLATAMAIFYHEPMPDVETAAKLDAGNSIYEYNDADFETWLRAQARLEGKELSIDVANRRATAVASRVVMAANPTSGASSPNGSDAPSEASGRRSSAINSPAMGRRSSVVAPKKSRKSIAPRASISDGGLNNSGKDGNFDMINEPVRLVSGRTNTRILYALGSDQGLVPESRVFRKLYLTIKRYLRFVRGVQRLLHKARQTLHLARIIYDLTMYIASRTFTARQARFLVKYAPKGRAAKDGKNIEMDVRIDLAVMLFPKIKDLQNYGQIRQLFTPEEEGYLICRVGYLNIFYPIIPEGWIELDCSRREERQILKMLMHLCKCEPGQSWIGATLRFDRFQLLSPGWELKQNWYTIEPMKGLVSLRFFSGDGQGLLGCAPNYCLRTALCALTAITVTPDMRGPFPPISHADLRQYLLKHMTDLGIVWNYEDSWGVKPQAGQAGADDAQQQQLV